MIFAISEAEVGRKSLSEKNLEIAETPFLTLFDSEREDIEFRYYV